MSVLRRAASPRRPAPVAVRVLSVPVVVLVLVAGGWAAGGLVTNDFTLSMLLTTAWIGVVGLACLALVLRRREMWPALAAFAVVATAAGIYLGSETLIDDEVDEDVVTASAPAAARSPGETGASRKRPTGNVLLSEGRFATLAHDGRGTAQVIEVEAGRRVLTLTGFETDNGPDLRVYLSTADAGQDSAGDDFVDLGGLKGNIGDQQYDIPRGVDLDRLTKVLVWCRAFSVGFTAAQLKAPGSRNTPRGP
jgi:Electron transfer DM13